MQILQKLLTERLNIIRIQNFQANLNENEKAQAHGMKTYKLTKTF